MANQPNGASTSTNSFVYDHFFRLSQDMMCIVGKNGRFTWASAAFERVLGWPLADLLNKPFLNYIHPDDKQRFPAQLAQHTQTNPPQPIENRLRCANGSYKVVAWRAELISGGGLYAVAHDLTPVAPPLWSQDVAYLQALFDLLVRPSANVETDLVRALERAAELLAMDRGVLSRIVGNRCVIQYTTPNSGLQKGQYFDLAQTCCGLTFNSEGAMAIEFDQQPEYANHPCRQSFGLEAYIGATVWVRGERYGTLNFSRQQPRLTPFAESDKHFVELLACWIGTLIERQQTQQAAFEADLLWHILDSVGYAIIGTDPVGTIQSFNPAAERMLGYTASELIGQATPALFHDLAEVKARAQEIAGPTDKPVQPTYDMFVTTARKGELEQQEWLYVAKNGRRIPVLLTISALRNPQGEVTGYLGIATDLTRQKEAEQEMRQSREELEREIVRRTAELSEANILLKTQVSERDDTNTILRKRAAELEIVTKVSAAATQIAETETLLQEVVNLIKVSFDLYHAHIYELNDVGDALVLSVGAGEVGRQLRELGHTIPLTEKQSLAVRATLTREGVIENDLQKAPGYLPNPLLPHSRSSLTIPMIVSDEVLGVLNVQSDKVDHFSEEDIRIQKTLATQIALALQNTRLLARTQQAVAELNTLTRRLSREGWESYLHEQTPREQGFAYDLHRLMPLHNGRSLPETAVATPLLRHELLVQGEQIGQLTLTAPYELQDEAADIVDEIAEQLSAHIENLRLSEQTRQALAQTEALYAGSDRIVRARTLFDVLTALVESSVWQGFSWATLLFFDQPWQAQPPELIRIEAVWGRAQREPVKAGSSGAEYRAHQFPIVATFQPDRPMVFVDVANDPRIDLLSRQFVLETLRMQGIIFFPLVAGDQWFGFFTVQSPKPLEISEEELRQMSTLTDQAATVLQSLRLYQQTQTALAQTEMLYQVSTRLNAAASLDDIAEAIVIPGADQGATWAGLWLLAETHPGQPQQLMLAGTWAAQAESIETAVAAPAFESLVLRSPAGDYAPAFISTVDETLPLPLQAICHQLTAVAIVVLPLHYGERALGWALVAWPQPVEFQPNDRQLYRLLAAQAGVAVNSQLLLRDSQQRSQQLEKLAQTEAALSQANNEEEILQAAISQLAVEGVYTIALCYLTEPASNLTLEVQEMWHNGRFLGAESTQLPSMSTELYPFLQLILARPDEMLAIVDIHRDPRTTMATPQTAESASWSSLVVLPLRSGRRWQGLLVMNWPEPHYLTPDEQFILPRLMESIAATVATRRAFLAQQAARQEVATLYEASRRLNEARSLPEILSATVEGVAMPTIQRAAMWLFEWDPHGEIAAARILANWSRGDGLEPMPLGTRFRRGKVSALELMLTSELMFVEDVANDGRFDEEMLALAQERQLGSMVIMPLYAGTVQRGVITMASEKPHVFTPQEMRTCRSLMPQVALVLENKALLEEAENRAQREQLLREVTEKVRSSMHLETVMKTAVAEVGRVLGRRAFIYLNEEELSE